MPGNFLKDYFGFNRQQRNGLLVLMIISFILLLIRITYPYFIKPDPIIVEDLPLVERVLDSTVKPKPRFEARIEYGEEKTAGPSELFSFDPNTVTREQLIQLGFRPKAAKAFVKFRKKGFKFRKKTDFKKVRAVSEELYTKLEPFILIPEEAKKEKRIDRPEESEKRVRTDKQLQRLDLNTSDSASLVKLNGIGPSYAKRILKYRSILGGFVSVEQLKEVYGFSEEVYQKVKDQFMIGKVSVRKINLDKDDFKTINKHPYLNYELTKAICNMRRRNTITRPVLHGILGDENLYQKLLPYLDID